MSEGDWNWQFRTPAKRTYDSLDDHAQDRITDKLDEIINDQWRDPDEYLEPLTGCHTRNSGSGSFGSAPSATPKNRYSIYTR